MRFKQLLQAFWVLAFVSIRFKPFWSAFRLFERGFFPSTENPLRPKRGEWIFSVGPTENGEWIFSAGWVPAPATKQNDNSLIQGWLFGR